MTTLLVVLAVVVAVLAALVASSVRILREYERAVVFRLGRLLGEKGPGLILLIPAIDRMVRVDLRTIVADVPSQDLITRDNVPAKVNAVTYFRVVDAVSSVIAVEHYLTATSQIAQTTLRSALGKADLDALLAERERLNEALQQIIDEQTDPWGVKVTAVEIKHVEIPSGMQRAMARQAEAERERRAKVINAEGEFQASERLRDAADVLSPNPVALQLRYLQTLTDMGDNEGSTIVFPFPIDIIQPFLERVGTTSAANRDQPEVTTSEQPTVGTREDRDQLAVPATIGGNASAEADAPNTTRSPASPARGRR